jgi:predicted CopG family antitoxin
MPPKKYKSLTVSIEIYNELEKIKREKNFDSFNDVIKDLIRKYSPTVNIEDLVNKICDASKIDRNLYLIDCNGRKAIVPEKMIKVISENFNIIIRLKEQ